MIRKKKDGVYHSSHSHKKILVKTEQEAKDTMYTAAVLAAAGIYPGE